MKDWYDVIMSVKIIYSVNIVNTILANFIHFVQVWMQHIAIPPGCPKQCLIPKCGTTPSVNFPQPMI